MPKNKNMSDKFTVVSHYAAAFLILMKIPSASSSCPGNFEDNSLTLWYSTIILQLLGFSTGQLGLLKLKFWISSIISSFNKVFVVSDFSFLYWVLWCEWGFYWWLFYRLYFYFCQINFTLAIFLKFRKYGKICNIIGKPKIFSDVLQHAKLKGNNLSYTIICNSHIGSMVSLTTPCIITFPYLV